MKLIIDIGNTRAKVVVFDGNAPVEVMMTDHELTGVKDLSKKLTCVSGIVSTTAGLTEKARECLKDLKLPLLYLNSETPLPIRNRYHTPQTLGTDRLAAVIGAWSMEPGKDLLVIDLGTCITYDFLDHEGNYWGGNISPGLEMRLKALHQQTARLPLVSREGEVPELGYDTETALRSGVIQGIRYEIEGYIRHFKQKYPSVLIFLTGGDAINLDMSEESCIFAVDFLVPRGLNTILAYNE